MFDVFLSLGSNSGARHENLRQARMHISAWGVIKKESTCVETSPWGVLDDQPDYLNQVIWMCTSLEPLDLLKIFFDIELRLGRNPSEKGQCKIRPIDIDMLSFEDRVIKTQTLTLPHPQMHARRFVLEPLLEIAPDWIHPVLGKNVSELLQSCPIIQSD